MLSQMATLTIKGNNTGGTANAADLTVAQVKTMLGISSYTVPTVTVYTSGTGTYTTPAGALYLTVEMLGGGGGGGGSGTGSPGNGGAGNNTTFGTTFLVANGGGGGGAAAGAGGAGGTASGGDINLTGGAGGAGITIGTGAGVGYGGMGGVSVFGGASPLTNSAAIAAAEIVGRVVQVEQLLLFLIRLVVVVELVVIAKKPLLHPSKVHIVMQ